MKTNDKLHDKSRRQFLGFSLLVGAGALMPAVTASGAEVERQEQEKVRLITADGKVVEVEKGRMPDTGRKKPVTDEELKEWLEQEGG